MSATTSPSTAAPRSRSAVARGGQVQLLQPLLTLLWAGLVLGEQVGAGTVLAAGGVLASVVVTQRARVGHAAGRRPGRALAVVRSGG